jgi:hypothetical protein
VQIDKSILISDNIFKITLCKLNYQKRKKLILKGLKYEYLKQNGEYLLMDVLSNGIRSEIVVDPKEVEETIDSTIQSLIELEYYEQCAVLKEIRDSFKEEYTK